MCVYACVSMCVRVCKCVCSCGVQCTYVRHIRLYNICLQICVYGGLVNILLTNRYNNVIHIL